MEKYDVAHIETEKKLAELENKIAELYRNAVKGLDKTITEYFDNFKKADENKIKQLESGKITEEEYKAWRIEKIADGKRYRALRDKLAEKITKANEIAMSYINNDVVNIYALNRNYIEYEIEKIYGNLDFILYDENTMKRLIVEEPDLMPNYPEQKAIKRGIDLAYGKQQITSQITSSLLQGQSLQQTSKELLNRLPDIGKNGAIRAARTAYTSAQNGGRMDSYAAADKMGIKVRKRWIATKDRRTRRDHGDADGQTVDWDEPFIVGGEKMMYPGDPSASGRNLYNCRCTMRTVEKEGIEAEPRMMRVKNEKGEYVIVKEMTYKEWEKWKRGN